MRVYTYTTRYPLYCVYTQVAIMDPQFHTNATLRWIDQNKLRQDFSSVKNVSFEAETNWVRRWECGNTWGRLSVDIRVNYAAAQFILNRLKEKYVRILGLIPIQLQAPPKAPILTPTPKPEHERSDPSPFVRNARRRMTSVQGNKNKPSTAAHEQHGVMRPPRPGHARNPPAHQHTPYGAVIFPLCTANRISKRSWPTQLQKYFLDSPPHHSWLRICSNQSSNKNEILLRCHWHGHPA